MTKTGSKPISDKRRKKVEHFNRKQIKEKWQTVRIMENAKGRNNKVEQ